MNQLRAEVLKEDANLQRQVTSLRNKSDDYGTRILRIEHDTLKIHELIAQLRVDHAASEADIINLRTVKLDIEQAEHSFKKVSSHIQKITDRIETI